MKFKLVLLVAKSIVTTYIIVSGIPPVVREFFNGIVKVLKFFKA